MGKAVRRQSAVSFGLSFLDVLCCGLGASVLLLLVVKHGPVDSIISELGLLETKLTEVQQDIAIKSDTKDELAQILLETESDLIQQNSRDSAKQTVSNLQARRLADLLRELSENRKKLASEQRELAKVAQQKLPESTEKPPQVTNKHLTGLLVNSNYVLIMLDASASMLAESLIEIIRIRASSSEVKLNARKWSRARSAALWVYDAIPEDANFQLLTFSDEVHDSLGNPASSTNNFEWLKKEDSQDAKNQLQDRLDAVIPHGPTDLKSGLEVAAAFSPKPLQIILITDGLPTKPGNTKLSRIRSCPGEVPGKTPLLTPACRASIFRNTLDATKRKLAQVRVDTVLFPLEGDSNAIHHYATLSHQFGGRVLSPIAEWP